MIDVTFSYNHSKWRMRWQPDTPIYSPCYRWATTSSLPETLGQRRSRKGSMRSTRNGKVSLTWQPSGRRGLMKQWTTTRCISVLEMQLLIQVVFLNLVLTVVCFAVVLCWCWRCWCLDVRHLPYCFKWRCWQGWGQCTVTSEETQGEKCVKIFFISYQNFLYFFIFMY